MVTILLDGKYTIRFPDVEHFADWLAEEMWK